MARPGVSFLFENAARPDGARIAFADPRAEICARDVADVDAALTAIDRALARGMWVAGYFAYELGYALEPRLRPLIPQTTTPLLRVCVFDSPCPAPPLTAAPVAPAPHIQVDGPSDAAYLAQFDRARQWILDGDIYQVNLSFPLRLQVTGPAAEIYGALRSQARASASAFLDFGDEAIVSLSPETFFACDRGRIRTRPMKGTRARGLTGPDDLQAKRALRADPKERAENLMIVDLLRNDLARVARPGSVAVSDMFTVETFPQLHTMTSGVSAQLRDDAQLSDILRALFPCGSVTGAPKIRAMEIIRALEPTPRGVYCGAIGFAGPDRMAFNVAIRTLHLSARGPAFSVGSGIVADSIGAQEYAECLLKARFLTQAPAPFDLIETMRWRAGQGAVLGPAHDERSHESAAYFGYPLSALAAEATAQAAAQRYGGLLSRVRMTLSADGRITASVSPLADEPSPIWRFALSSQRIDSRDRFYHHKTTRRALYDAELAQARARGLDEVVFLNERGEVAEGAISTLFLWRDGALTTPPLASGALNGCLRRSAIDAGLPIVERRILRDELQKAEAVWFGNAVRGFIPGHYTG